MSFEQAIECPRKKVKFDEEEENGAAATTKLVGECSDPTEVFEAEGETPAFTYQYHIVKRIMKYLSLHNVLQASQVNKQWADIGRVVRRQRKNQADIILYHPYSPHHQLAFEYFNGIEVSQEAKQLVESGNGGLHAYSSKSSSKRKFPDLVDHLKSNLRESLLKSYDEAQLLVGFGTSSLLQYLINKGHKESSGQLMDKISGSIQSSIPCIATFSCGLIAPLPSLKLCNSLELEKPKLPCFSYLSVPKVPGLQAKTFVVTKTQGFALQKNMSIQHCKEILGISDDDEPNLKAIMLLTGSNSNDRYLIKAVHDYVKANPKVALAGGIPDKVLEGSEFEDKVHSGGVLFYGNELVRASCVALLESNTSSSNRSKIEELKTSLLPGEHSFAFMFACNGRGHRMHKRLNVESDLFNAALPSTPLIGIFTYGELCHEVLGPVLAERSILPPPNIVYAYTTVFLMISYRHKLDDDTHK